MADTYLKPQSALKHMDDYIYPLTTADQVIVDETEKTRLSEVLSKTQLYFDEVSSSGGGVNIDAASIGGYNVSQLMNKLYPIGSIYITTEATNPGLHLDENNEEKAGLLGFGSWELIGKGFKEIPESNRKDTEGRYFIINTTNTTSVEVDISRSNSAIDMRLWFVNKVAWGDTELEVGSFNFENLGITGFPQVMHELGSSDGANCVVNFSISTDGIITSLDAFAETSAAKASSIFLPIHFSSIPHELMLDSACDKFYWKRIA